MKDTSLLLATITCLGVITILQQVQLASYREQLDRWETTCRKAIDTAENWKRYAEHGETIATTNPQRTK